VDEYYYSRSRKTKKKSGFRFLLFFILLLALAVLAFFSFTQFIALQSMRLEINRLEEQLNLIEDENKLLWEQYDQIVDENETLREENLMLRSSKVIRSGIRETNKVAITIDDGYGNTLILTALEYLKNHDVRATFFNLGECIRNEPAIWKQAVEEGHELANHTYSHRYLTTMNDEEIVNELDRWQEEVNQALGYSYSTYFFRPPGMDGFVDSQANKTKHYLDLIGHKGLISVLWDVDHFSGLGTGSASPDVITNYILQNVRGGSIILLHFKDNDVAALPSIISGLRRQGLEPCSLSELLLAEPQS
jgi:peptidoglycan-N-acetylglucosamine deacetylase